MNKRIYTGIFALSIVLMLGTTVPVFSARLPDNPPAATFMPKQTKVVVLPVANLSGEKDARQKTEQAKRGSEELTRQFEDRGFQIIDSSTVSQTLSTLKIDLNEEGAQTQANLQKIGQELGADIVVFGSIKSVEQRRGKAPFGETQRLEGHATLELWVLNVKSETVLLSARRSEGESKKDVSSEFDTGSRHIQNAIEIAIREGLKDTMLPYPVLKK